MYNLPSRVVTVIGVLALFWFLTASGRSQQASSQDGVSSPAGSEDASSAILSELSAANQDVSELLQRLVDRGGNIELPSGRHRISKTIAVDLAKIGPVSVSGNGTAVIVNESAGPAFRFIGTHYKSADPEGFEEQVWVNERMPLVDGIAIEGKHEHATGIEAVGTMQLTVTRCHFRKLQHGIHLRENNRNAIVADCHIYENRGIGLFLDDVNLHQINVTGCHISYCDGGGIVSRQGNVRNLHITGCDLESNMGSPNESAANVEIDCRGSNYGTAEIAITGCTIQHNNDTADSANIRILGRSNDRAGGAKVQEGNITITGNILSDVQTNIHLVGCRGVTIVGNTLWMGYQHHLKLESCTAVVIGANNLDRNPRYDYADAASTHDANLLVNCERCLINGLLITHVQGASAGLELRRCRAINVTNCSIFDCSGPELLLTDCNNCRVSGCMVDDQRFETDASPADRIVVTGGERNRVQ